MIKNGVDWYTSGVALVEVNFPENDVRCRHCKFCRPEKEAGRFWCRLINEIIYDIDTIDGRCPIQFYEQDKINDRSNEGETKWQK